ncbi:hypothetical protein MZM54_05415 [[Brevibacterium] frigoritolerans]|nr:hypothetical protein [Peribacillus frigoritolerans]
MKKNDNLMPEQLIQKLLTKKKIKAYEYNGSLSLDREYLEGLAPQAREVREVQAEMYPATYQKLKDVNDNTFDLAAYTQLLESDKVAEADKYFEENAKCLAISIYDDISIFPVKSK